jgi:hypothetical protein
MTMMEIIWSKHNRPVRKTFVIWDFDDPVWIVNPNRKPTAEELSKCPKVFTCYCCCERHSQSELGGRYHEQWFCQDCIPYIDEWIAGAMVWFDNHNIKHPNKSAKLQPRPPTDTERMENTVRWAKQNGKPIN